jgi:hypothetical protein
LADHENGKLRLALGDRRVIDRAEGLADRPHLRPAETVPHLVEQIGIADVAPRFRRFDEQAAHRRGVADRHRQEVSAVFHACLLIERRGQCNCRSAAQPSA